MPILVFDDQRRAMYGPTRGEKNLIVIDSAGRVTERFTVGKGAKLYAPDPKQLLYNPPTGQFIIVGRDRVVVTRLP